jgi:N-acetylmuramoyl-L-alanine amidase
MPGTVWLGEHGSAPMARYDIVCVHTIVGYAPAHAAHFSTDTDGHIYQSRDTAYRSAANADGNPRIIAVENADMPPPWDTRDGHAVPGFTPAQIEAIAQVYAWCHTTHGVPLQLCPDSRPGSRGLAYHRQGIDGNFAGYAYPGRLAGGEVWTKARGKVCPGDRRIAALQQILDRAIAITGGIPAPPEEPDDMYSDTDRAQDKGNNADPVLMLGDQLQYFEVTRGGAVVSWVYPRGAPGWTRVEVAPEGTAEPGAVVRTALFDIGGGTMQAQMFVPAPDGATVHGWADATGWHVERFE